VLAGTWPGFLQGTEADVDLPAYYSLHSIRWGGLLSVSGRVPGKRVAIVRAPRDFLNPRVECAILMLCFLSARDFDMIHQIM